MHAAALANVGRTLAMARAKAAILTILAVAWAWSKIGWSVVLVWWL